MVAREAQPRDTTPTRLQVQPHGDGFRLQGGVRGDRLRGAQGRPARSHDRQPRLVARGLRPLRPLLHQDDLARGGHLQDRRRPWRRRHGGTEIRAPQQLAGQRQPRQGQEAPLADQEEVRQPHKLGGPADPDGTGRDRVNGRAGAGIRWRQARHLAPRGRHLLGKRGRVAR